MQRIDNKERLSSFVDKHNLRPLLSAFPDDQLRLYRINKGEMIYTAGQEIREMYFIVEGKVKIFSTTLDDKRLVLRFQKALVLIGEIEFIHNDPAIHSVEASTECLAIGLSYKILRENIGDNLKFLQFLLEEITYKFRTKTNISSLNLLYPVEVRFASYLLSISSEGTALFQEEMRHSSLSDIAEMIGTSYRHLNRVIQKMCSNQVIERVNGKIHILDLEKLKEMAKNNVYE
ncbi:MAG: Crp/Fnr family transcriptional regulator [Bacillus sp. (in: firmicutes)]